MIAHGNAGEIQLVQFNDYGVGYNMRKDGVEICAMKVMKNAQPAVFTQEVAIMWSLRGHSCIIDLYGYSQTEACILMPYY